MKIPLLASDALVPDAVAPLQETTKTMYVGSAQRHYEKWLGPQWLLTSRHASLCWRGMLGTLVTTGLACFVVYVMFSIVPRDADIEKIGGKPTFMLTRTSLIGFVPHLSRRHDFR